MTRKRGWLGAKFSEPLLRERAKLHVAEPDFGSFGLEQDPAPGGVRAGPLVGDFVVHDELDRVAVGEKLHQVPLAVRIFVFHFRIAITGYILPRPLVETG